MAGGKSIEYGRDNFPFAGVFEDLTEKTVDGSFSSTEAYLWYQRQRQHRDLIPSPDYASTSVTSGGHARIPGIDTYAVIEKNTQTARRMLGELAVNKVITKDQIILPTDLGHIPHWRQSDYIGFWLSVIGGFELELTPANRNAGLFEGRVNSALKHEEVDIDRMNNSEWPANERATEYFKFAKAFSLAANSLGVEAKRIARLINLIDPLASLGSRTERAFAHLRGIPSYSIYIAGPGPRAADAIVDRRLKADLETIISYGAASVELLPGNHFILKENVEIS